VTFTILTAIFAVFLWWLSTGVVFFATSLPYRTVKPVVAVSSGALLIALTGIVESAGMTGPLGAFIGFTAAIVVWGWCEALFLLGIVTGPNRAPLPDGMRGWSRFRLATGTLIHHELLLVVAGLLVLVLAVGGSMAAPLTFGTLWIMRLSAKLNLFAGTANFSEEIAPERLRYLATYFGRARTTILLPISLIGGTLLAVHFGTLAAEAATGTLACATYTLLCTIAALGVFEHAMMMIPLRDGALWTWIFAVKDTDETAPGWNPGHARTGDTG
jgi:putative photosynthetic complex assembly protein 2